MLRVPPKHLEFAKSLRAQTTDAEQLIWYLLRNRRFGGFKFRRQYPMPPYVLDFYCAEKRLAIELDGGQHADRSNADVVRTAWLESKGLAVVRFWNDNVLADTEAVLDALWQRLHA